MKKIMIAAAIVCAAAMSQAAAFTWTTNSKMYGPDLANLTVGTMKAVGAQLSASSIAWVYTLTFENSDSKTDEVTINQSAMGWKAGKVNTTSSSTAVYKGTGEEVVTVDYSIVVTGSYKQGDVTWYFTSDAITGQEKFGELADLGFVTGSVTEWTVTKSGGDPTPTPEPTSGILLLVGMAGLALRRRRA